MARAPARPMASVNLERVCPYCSSNRLTFLEHGTGGTLFQCQLCSRAAVQRWEPTAEEVPKAPPDEGINDSTSPPRRRPA